MDLRDTTHCNRHMDLLYVALLVSVVLLILLRNKYRSKAKIQSSKLPPGPRGLPIIGSIHYFLGSLAHRVLRDLAATHGPLIHVKLGQVSIVVASSAETAAEVMKTHDTIFASRPQTLSVKIITYDCVDLIFSPYGEYWRQMRKLCVLELLSANRVQSFRSIREEEARLLVHSIARFAGSSSPINVSSALMIVANNVITRATLGSKFRNQKGYLEALNDARVLMSGFQMVDLFPESKPVRVLSGAKYKLERSSQKMDRSLEGIIEEHKERKIAGEMNEGAETLLDVLLGLQEKGELGFSPTNDNIKAVIFDLFAAGTGTISATMAWAMSELIKNPTVLAKAQSEVREVLAGRNHLTEDDTNNLHYLKLVIKETLRLHPPSPLLVPRESTEDCYIQGYLIPSKTRVLVNVWAIGREPRYWDEPETFKPERFENGSIDFKGLNFQYLPFGAGRRACPGVVFGLAMTELMLAHLLYYFDWKMPGRMSPDELDMSESFGVGLRRKHDLHLCATSCVPLPI